jgi:hypothetical protein
MGFGSGTFRGGRGVDVLTYKPGTYSIAADGDGSFVIDGVMSVSGFERFGTGATSFYFVTAASMGSLTFAGSFPMRTAEGTGFAMADPNVTGC